MEATGTVDKAVDVLFHLHGAGAPCGVTAIGRALDIPKSSVHRLLATLSRRGLVERDEAGRYRPGIALVALGLGVLESEPIVTASRPTLEAHAASVGETFFLVAARQRRLVVLEKAEGTGFLRAAPTVGSTVPVHATAVGKLYLAFAPDALERDADFGESFTEQTLSDEAALARSVAAAAREGLAWNRDEWIQGLSVLAAPIHIGPRMAGAVALALATSSLSARDPVTLEERIRSAAAEISGRLSGEPRDV